MYPSIALIRVMVGRGGARAYSCSRHERGRGSVFFFFTFVYLYLKKQLPLASTAVDYTSTLFTSATLSGL